MVDARTKTGKAACGAALAALAIGVGGLLGWIFHIGRFKSLLNGAVAINPVTALALILAGTSAVLAIRAQNPGNQNSRAWQVLTARGCAVVVAFFGLMRLVALVSGWDAGVDQWLFPVQVARQLPIPSRIAPNAALNLLLLGGALLFVDGKRRFVRLGVELSAVVAGIGSLLAILGYAYDIQVFYRLDGFIPMALPAAVAFALLIMAILLSHTDGGWLAMLAGDGAAGAMARRLLPAAVLVPAVLGWLTFRGRKTGVFPAELGEAAFVAGTILILAFLVCWSAREVFNADRDRKKAEEAGRESEERFAGAFEHAPIGVALVSPDGRWLKVNRALCDMLGYPEAWLLAHRFQDITIHPEDLKADQESVRRMIAGEIRSAQSEKHYRHARGHLFPVLLNVSLARDRRGEPLYFIAQTQDLTSRVAAEQEVRFNERRFRSLVEATTAIVWDMPASGEFEVDQPRWTEFTGQSFTELRGWGWLQVVHAEDRAETKRVWLAAQASRSTYEVEHRLRARDQTYRNMVVRAVPILAEDGGIIQWIGIHRDVSERKRTEEIANRLAAIVESSDDAIISKTLDGIITSWNRAAEKMFGYSAVEIIGQPLQVMIPPDRPHDQAELHARFARGEIVRHIETEWVRKDGRRVEIAATISPIKDPAGKIVGASKIIRDITARKRVESQMFQSQKLETVGKLAGGIAHEFNGILTAIIGQSELLLGNLPVGSLLAKNATEISRAAGRAAILTRQLLAYGRKQFLQPETLNLNQVINGMESMLRYLTGGDIHLRIIAAADLKVVKADAGQIEQVIMNMAINAREAMPGGGQLTLESANVSFDQESPGPDRELNPGSYVMLAITDTGLGMSAEVRALAFEPFFTTKGVGQGTGLGLSTCYGIIKQSGGHISIDSEPGRGASFKIYLPRVEPGTETTLRRPDPADLPRGTETIIMVEDDPAMREMAATLLRRLGYTVLTAGNGIEALDLTRRRETGKIDLVFTDIVMPRMTGRELADLVNALYPRTKILFASAYTENTIVHQGALNPGAGFLQKPFTPSAMARKIREVLDQSAAPEAAQ